jgi:predicted extracellular nuclease
VRRLLSLLAVSLLALPLFAQSGFIISEYAEGSSNNKAIELYNGTASPISLDAYRVQMYFNGSSSAGLTIANLSGTLAPGATYVIAHASADIALRNLAQLTNGSGWFNGDDAIVLAHDDGTVIDSLGQVGNDPGAEWGSGLTSTADNTLRRKAGITTGNTNVSDAFDPSVEWDGYANNTWDGFGFHNAPPPPPPPPAVAEIFEIQGAGSASPFAGQTVESFDNIVTAVGPQGFFMQTPDYRADASSATSNGIYVFTSSAPTVQVGDQVDVKGGVVEFFNFTEFSGGLTVTVDASNQPVPAHFELPIGFSAFETVEGMLVRATNGSAADGTDQFGETMMVVGPRPFRTPGLGGDAHPEIFDVDPTALGGTAPSIVGGASIELAEGPLAFDFGDYSIWATSLSYTNPPFPRGARARAAGEFTVAAQNMLQLFDDRDDPSINETISDPAAYAARLVVISAHIRNVLGAPDVLAVSEVENLVTLSDLAAQLNGDDATLNYVAYLLDGNDIGGIDVGFLVRDTVAVGSLEQLGADDTYIQPDGTPDILNDRPPLLLRGAYIGNGAAFPIAVVAVHQRSLISVNTARVQAKRQAQAETLAAYLAQIQSVEPDARIVVTGDFNAFEFNDGYVDVMGILTSGAGLTNQVLGVEAGERYSYVQNGVAQVLDHSLTSSGLDPYVRELIMAHANADAPASLAAPSDHDGVVLYVMSDYDGDGLADDADSCATGDSRPTVILGECDSRVANLAFEGGCTLADQIGALRASAKNHGQFIAEVAKLLNGMVKSGELSGADKGAIESCAAQWN